jgi:hypothetical protein
MVGYSSGGKHEQLGDEMVAYIWGPAPSHIVVVPYEVESLLVVSEPNSDGIGSTLLVMYVGANRDDGREDGAN